MSRVFALIAGLVLLPFMVILLPFALVFQGRPLFFVQERVGLHRKPFLVYKLRTMVDRRVTPFGRLLRKTGLDELPQLINVVRGEMAFVGPRPLTLEDIVRLEWDGEDHDVRWSVLPGMTGPAQISPVCSRENTWKHDEEYCRRSSLAADLRIVTLTVLRVIRARSEVR